MALHFSLEMEIKPALSLSFLLLCLHVESNGVAYPALALPVQKCRCQDDGQSSWLFLHAAGAGAPLLLREN